MTADRFVISIDPIEELTEREFHLTVAVYPELDAMRRAARRYHPEAGEHLDDAGACFQIAKAVAGGSNRLGIMRLSGDLLNPWVIMHEAVHAGVALAFAECNRTRGGRLPAQPITLDPYLAGGWAHREELIAYGAHAFAFGIMAELGLIDHPTEEG